MPALGTTKKVDRNRPLSRFEYHLGLSDALIHRPHESSHLAELADSFSHDVLNLAALAGRLLWYEGVTPEMWRSHDLVAVGVDAEAYFVMLQTACDIMADVVATLGAKKKQAPSESFHQLNKWALKYPNRLAAEFRLVAAEIPWFTEINTVRTKLVHRGGDIWIYTERTCFEWDVSLPGSKVSRGKYLLQSIQQLTRSMLEFSDQLGEVIMARSELNKSPTKSIISGVYVPALYHLLDKYQVPKESETLLLNARCLLACGGYVEACYFEYPDSFWWRFLLGLSERIGTGPTLVDIPVNISGQIHDCKFVFAHGGKAYGIVVCDQVVNNEKWLRVARDSVARLHVAQGLSAVALVGREVDGGCPSFLPGGNIPVIVDGDPTRLSEKAFTALTD